MRSPPSTGATRPATGSGARRTGCSVLARASCRRPSGPDVGGPAPDGGGWLEQTDGSAVGVDVDVERRRLLAETGHLQDVATERHQPAGAGVGTDVADRQRVALGCVEPARLVRERE